MRIFCRFWHGKNVDWTFYHTYQQLHLSHFYLCRLVLYSCFNCCWLPTQVKKVGTRCIIWYLRYVLKINQHFEVCRSKLTQSYSINSGTDNHIFTIPKSIKYVLPTSLTRYTFWSFSDWTSYRWIRLIKLNLLVQN